MKKRTLTALALAGIMAMSTAGCGVIASNDNASGGSSAASGASSASASASSASAAASSGSAAAGDNSEVFIGVSIGDSTQERWQKEIAMFEAYAEEQGIKLTVQTAENDATKQMNQCENMISQGVQAIICQPVDTGGAGTIAQACADAGVTSIAYDRFIQNGPLTYWVGFDDFQVGEAQSQMVVDGMGGKGNVVVLKGDEGMTTTHDVYKGNISVLQPLVDDGSITIVTEQYCKGWSSDEALKHLENALSQFNNDIQGVVCQNDGLATGAIQALSAQGLAGKVAVSGQDCDLAAVQRVADGTQTGTVYKPLEKMNHAALDIAIMAAKGEDPTAEFSLEGGNWSDNNNGYADIPSMLLDVISLNKDNVGEVLIADNFYTYDEIYATVPEDERP